MYKIITISTLAGLLTITCGGGGNADTANIDLVPGNYKVDSIVKMEGVALPPMSTTQCFTKEKLLPKGNTDSSNCTVKEQNVSGNTVSWKMDCQGNGMEGKMTYAGESFSGTMQVETQGRKVNMTLTGKRVGDCTN